VSVDQERVAKAVREILEAVGEDPDRDGLVETPARVARMYAEVLSGIGVDPSIDLTFDADHDEMVMVHDIPVYSLCEHHLVPFMGRAHVAYIPSEDGRITGLSKLPRLVNGFARRLQVQERLTAQVADCICEHLRPQGVAVVIEASHACMTARGVHTPGVMMTTSRMMGVFREDERSRREVLALMGY
jgi:GTP cyclohydrolase I